MGGIGGRKGTREVMLCFNFKNVFKKGVHSKEPDKHSHILGYIITERL